MPTGKTLNTTALASNKTLTCIVIDEDERSIEMIAEYIARVPWLKLVKSYMGPDKAFEELPKRKRPVDLMFANIEIEAFQILDFARLIDQKAAQLILITSFAEFPPESYGFNAKQMLEKPFNYLRFTQSLTRAMIDRLSEKPYIIVTHDAGSHSIKFFVHDIVCIEAVLNYIKIHTKTGFVVSGARLSKMEADLEPYGYFKKANSRYLVSLLYIVKIQWFTVFLSNKMEVRVSDPHQEGWRKYKGGY